jgi:MoaA/NifB/PqqE/SkfB family radical SAM enzyme
MAVLRVAKNLMLGRPILGVFDVTKLCNERCAFCNVWKTSSDDMSLAEITQKAAELRSFGIGYVFLQGGEPTLRNDLVDIIDIFLSQGIKPTVITNGTRLTDELASAIAERSCNLAISIDSLERQKYMLVRGKDKLQAVMRNVENIARYTATRKGNWAITTTITRVTTLDDVKTIEAFAHKHGFMFAIRPYVHVKGVAGKRDERLVLDKGESNEIFQYMYERARKDNFLASLIYAQHVRYLRGEDLGECDAMRHSFFLKEGGGVAPCIEYPQLRLRLDQFATDKKRHRDEIHRCSCETPCFYNDAREVGILWKNRWSILLNSPKIARQFVRYGRFF